MRSAVMKYGTNQWHRVASLLTSKTAAECRSRWFDHLDPRVSASPWSPEEDSRLIELHSRMPNKWRSIAATLGSRSAEQCLARFQVLTPDLSGAAAGSEDGMHSQDSLSVFDKTALGPDAEKQLIAEARARLSNSLGRKAKRKLREREEAETSFWDSIEQRRQDGGKLKPLRHTSLSVPEVLPPGHLPPTGATSSKISAPKIPEPSILYQPRKPNRPKLDLPPPKVPEPSRRFQFNAELSKGVLKLLDCLPAPSGRSLMDLYKSSHHKISYDSYDGPNLSPEPASDGPETSLQSETPEADAEAEIQAEIGREGSISYAARALLREELERNVQIPENTAQRAELSEDIVRMLDDRETLLRQVQQLNH